MSPFIYIATISRNTLITKSSTKKQHTNTWVYPTSTKQNTASAEAHFNVN